MAKLVDKGYTTFDLADHYGPAEDFVGAFESQQKAQAAKGQVCLIGMAYLQVHVGKVPRLRIFALNL